MSVRACQVRVCLVDSAAFPSLPPSPAQTIRFLIDSAPPSVRTSFSGPCLLHMCVCVCVCPSVCPSISHLSLRPMHRHTHPLACGCCAASPFLLPLSCSTRPPRDLGQMPSPFLCHFLGQQFNEQRKRIIRAEMKHTSPVNKGAWLPYHRKSCFQTGAQSKASSVRCLTPAQLLNPTITPEPNP